MSELKEAETAMLEHPDPVVTAGELAEEMGCSSRHALDLLRSLEHVGDVESKDVGARAVAWWHVDRVRSPRTTQPQGDEERRVSEGTTVESPSEAHTAREKEQSKPPTESEIRDEVWEIVDEVASGWEEDSRLENRRLAAATALQYAIDHQGVGKSSDVLEEIREKYPVEGQNEETYWRQNIRDILQKVGEYSKAEQAYVVKSL